MSDKSLIHWTDATLNPITGCSEVGPECDNCYAKKMSIRLKAMGQKNYEDGFKVRLHPHMLSKLSDWKRPRWIFLCSMSDPFHQEVPFDFLDEMHNEMRKANHHKYMILTKRVHRMNEYFKTRKGLNHVFYGVSVGLRQSLNRIKVLRSIDVEHRFVSFEPLLGDLFSPYLNPNEDDMMNLSGIEWVIIGGESGPKARRMKVEHAKKLVEHSKAMGCSIFFKQMGSVWARENSIKNGKGDIITEWPEWARIREKPYI